MTRFDLLRRFVVFSVVLSGLAVGSAGAFAHQPYYWKTVTVYVTVEKPYVDYVTKYDHCGKPYVVPVHRVKHVKVPVQKRIKVGY